MHFLIQLKSGLSKTVLVYSSHHCLFRTLLVICFCSLLYNSFVKPSMRIGFSPSKKSSPELLKRFSSVIPKKLISNLLLHSIFRHKWIGLSEITLKSSSLLQIQEIVRKMPNVSGGLI